MLHRMVTHASADIIHSETTVDNFRSILNLYGSADYHL